MKSVIGPVLVAVAFAVVGGAFWTAGHTEQRLAQMHQQIATLRYGDMLGDDETDPALRLASRLPRVGDELTADSRDERATAQYWRAEYTALAPKRDAGGALTETDAALALISANAEFRASERATDRADLLRRLDGVVKTYADVLKTNASADAAYNYEYAARLRETTQKARPAAAKSDAAKLAKRAAVATAGDLPAGPTLHGIAGGPPKGTEMSQFKIVIPKRGEERKDNPEAGKGGTKIRKG